MFTKDCFRSPQTQQERAKERLHEDHVRTVLEAAGPASGSPGQTMICTFCQYHMSGGASCLPEDIALRAAKGIAVFQARLQHTSAILGPWDVLSVGEHWKVISDGLGSFDPAFADEGYEISVANVRDALEVLVAALTFLKEELATRVHEACVPTHAKEMSTGPFTSHFKQVSSLSEINKIALLEQFLPKPSICNDGTYEGPLISRIYALVGDVHKLPRETQGKTTDCTCHVPWNQRSSWDRRGFVQYQLPAATSFWQSQSLPHKRLFGWSEAKSTNLWSYSQLERCPTLATLCVICASHGT